MFIEQNILGEFQFCIDGELYPEVRLLNTTMLMDWCTNPAAVLTYCPIRNPAAVLTYCLIRNLSMRR